jgi:hypothetical protein
MKTRFRILMIVALAALSLISTRSASAANRSWDWRRWDVEISNINTSANVFHVAETHIIAVTSGSFAGGDRSVGLDRVTSIDNVTVTDSSTPLLLRRGSNADDCPTTPGIFCLFTNSRNERDIYYNFLARTYAGQTRTIRLEYDVHGALRSYPDGDQMWWSPLASSRDFDVLASRVTVQTPSNRPLQKFGTYGVNWNKRQEGNTVVFDSTGRIGGSELAEIRVQYQHDPAMQPPPWQPAFDSQQAFLEKMAPVLNIALLALAVLFGIGGPLWVIIRYLTHGRDPNPVVVPEYLTEPPSDQPPGVVTTLVNEVAGMPEILATLLDLARRGFLVIEQDQHHGFFDRSTDFVFHRTDKSASVHPTMSKQFIDLNPASLMNAVTEYQSNLKSTGVEEGTGLRHYERILLDGLFPGNSSDTHLSALRNRFYSLIPLLKSNLYNEVVQAGYFPQSPEQIRGVWMFLGVVLLVIGAGVGLFLLLSNDGRRFMNSLSPMLPYPAFGLGLTGLVMLLVSNYMPAKTLLGSQEAAKWRAFRNYLKNINKYTDLQQAGDQFEKYIGYAVAFGFQGEWIRQFSRVLTEMPYWYYPTYLGGPWGGGYRHYGGYGSPAYSGESMGRDLSSGLGQSANMGGGLSGGLNNMSENLTQGLNAMNSGLTSLLNNASSVMTSHPSSSGGGGFSGGGSSGGGSSGGGSAGGH